MISLRSVLAVLAVLAVVKCQLALPEPVKGPTRIATVQEGLSLNSGVTIQHLPGTDNIVIAWVETDDQLVAETARGAILGTDGEVKTTFLISEENTVLSFQTPVQIVPHTNGSFSAIYACNLETSYFFIRSFDASGEALSDPLPILADIIPGISINAVYNENSGDIFIASVALGAPYILVYRVNATGDILGVGIYEVAASSVAVVYPTIAISGNCIAVSMTVVDGSTVTVEVLIAPIDDLNNSTTFSPYGGGSTISHKVLADPFNENSFVLMSATGLNSGNSSYDTYIIGTRFSYENESIATTKVTYPEIASTMGLSLYDAGGVMGLVVGFPDDPTFVLYPIRLTNDKVFELDVNQFSLVRTISANESAFEAYKDIRTGTTTWSTGSAVAWSEVSPTTGTFSIVAKIFGTFCGDNFAEGDEVCDGGVDCNANCTCPAGLVADNDNGCGMPPPSSQPITAPTRPISVGPVAAPNDATSDAYTTTAITLSASIVVAAAAALF